MNILIVDDEMPAVHGVLQAMNWKKLGITQTYVAYSMLDAIEVFQSHPIHLLLTDIEMRGGSGFDLIQWANTHPLNNYTSIILSSYPNFVYAKRAITLGVFEYLLKPIEDLQLEFTLSRAVAHHSNKASTQISLEQTDNELVDQSKKYIYEHISLEISRNDVAHFVGLCPEYFSSFFKKMTGQTLSDFIKNERVSFSKRLLKQTNLPISTISDNVGFDSLSYFSSVFKSVVGCTPREYRRSIGDQS